MVLAGFAENRCGSSVLCTGQRSECQARSTGRNGAVAIPPSTLNVLARTPVSTQYISHPPLCPPCCFKPYTLRLLRLDTTTFRALPFTALTLRPPQITSEKHENRYRHETLRLVIPVIALVKHLRRQLIVMEILPTALLQLCAMLSQVACRKTSNSAFLKINCKERQPGLPVCKMLLKEHCLVRNMLSF